MRPHFLVYFAKWFCKYIFFRICLKIFTHFVPIYPLFECFPVFVSKCYRMIESITVWKVSKYEVFSGPNTGKYGPETTPYLDTFHQVEDIDAKWVNPLSTNPTKWASTLKQFVGLFADELFECLWPFCEVDAKVFWGSLILSITTIQIL